MGATIRQDIRAACVRITDLKNALHMGVTKRSKEFLGITTAKSIEGESLQKEWNLIGFIYELYCLL